MSPFIRSCRRFPVATFSMIPFVFTWVLAWLALSDTAGLPEEVQEGLLAKRKARR